jgi:hypothetical protein
MITAPKAFSVLPLPDFLVGNMWAGVPLYTVQNLPGAVGYLSEVEVEFRSGSQANTSYQAKLSASNGDITIIPGTWSFIIPAQVLPLPAGTFYQSIKLYDSDTPPKPYTYTVGTISGTIPPTRS